MEIKSPLPSRQVNIEETDKNPKIEEAKKEEVVERTVSKPPKGLPISKGMGLGVVGFLIILAIIIGIFVFGRKKDEKTTGKATINYWGLWEEEAVLNGLIAKFEEKNPNIKVIYQKQNKENYRTRLESRLEKGDGPDIFRFHSSWVPMMSSRLENVPASVSRNLKLDEDFWDVYRRDLKKGNNYVGIPLMYDGLALFYNKDLLDAANKQVPKTWWGLSQLASELTVRSEDGKINVAGVAMGSTGNVDHWQDIIGLMLKQNGVALNQTDAITQKKIKDVIDFFRFFAMKNKWNIWSQDLPSSTQAFANGKVVFYFGPSWRIFEINQLNPQLNWAVAKVPQLPTIEGLDPEKVESGQVEAKLTDINWSSYWVEGVAKNSPNKAEAWKFLEFLASEEGLTDFYLAASQIREFGEIYPRKSLASKLADNKKLTVFVDGANSGVTGWPSSRTWDDGLNEELSKYIETAIGSGEWKEEVETALFSGISRVVNLYKIE